MRKTPYPKEMTVTDEGKVLYSIWRRVKRDTDELGPFAEYPNFYRWAIDNFFCIGSKLRKYNEHLPFTPDNCYFQMPTTVDCGLTAEQRRMASSWNRTVNVLRRACGMKLFEENIEKDMIDYALSKM